MHGHMCKPIIIIDIPSVELQSKTILVKTVSNVILNMFASYEIGEIV